MSVSLNQIIAVILAGGFGMRIRHLLPNLPKPMAPVAGRPFLEWVVRYLATQGITNVVISTGYLANAVSEHFQNRPIEGVNIRCVPEPRPLGTAGGFLNAVRSDARLPGAWLVLNGDSLVFADLASLASPLAEPETDGVMLGVSVPDTSRYGSLVRNRAGDLVGFAEKQPGAGVINAGVYLLRHALLQKFPNETPLSFERDVFPSFLEGGTRFRVVETSAPFLDIGTEESLSQAETFIRENAEKFTV